MIRKNIVLKSVVWNLELNKYGLDKLSNKKYIHNSVIIHSDKLNKYTNKGIEEDQLILSDVDCVKLKNVDELIKMKEELLNNNNNKNLLSDIDKRMDSLIEVDNIEMSSFNDCFPNYNNNSLLPKLIKAISNHLEEDEIKSIFQEYGIIKGLEKCLQNPDILKKLNIIDSVTTSNNETLSTIPTNDIMVEIKELQTTLDNVISNQEIMENKLELINKISNKIDKTLDVSGNFLNLWIKNQNNIDIVIKTASIISPFLAYRGLLATYIKVSHPVSFENIKNKQRLDFLLRQRRQVINKFNKISIPILGLFYYSLVFNKQWLDLSTNLINNTDINASFFLFLKNNIKRNVFLVFSIPVTIYILGYYGLPIVKYLCPSCFHYLAIIYNKFGILIVIYPIILWFIWLIIQSLLELYIFYLIDNNKELELRFLTKKSKWILNLVKEYKEGKRLGYNFYIRNSIDYILICLTILVLLYFLFI